MAVLACYVTFQAGRHNWILRVGVGAGCNICTSWFGTAQKYLLLSSLMETAFMQLCKNLDCRTKCREHSVGQVLSRSFISQSCIVEDRSCSEWWWCWLQKAELLVLSVNAFLRAAHVRVLKEYSFHRNMSSLRAAQTFNEFRLCCYEYGLVCHPLDSWPSGCQRGRSICNNCASFWRRLVPVRKGELHSLLGETCMLITSKDTVPFECVLLSGTKKWQDVGEDVGAIFCREYYCRSLTKK